MSAGTKTQETDPAKELAELFTNLTNFTPGSTDNTLKVLSTYFQIQPSDPLLYELLGMIAQRTNSLTDFIHHLQDDHLDDSTRRALVDGLNTCVQIINPINLNNRWDTVRSSVGGHNIILLRSFGQTARRYKPLRVVTPQEKADLLDKIEEALAEIDEDDEIPAWALASVKEGLRRLKIMVKYIAVFGHEAIIDHVLKMHGEETMLSVLLESKGFKYAKGLFQVASVIATTINILVSPIKVHDGVLFYKQHAHEIKENMPSILSHGIKLLPKPKDN